MAQSASTKSLLLAAGATCLSSVAFVVPSSESKPQLRAASGDKVQTGPFHEAEAHAGLSQSAKMAMLGISAVATAGAGRRLRQKQSEKVSSSRVVVHTGLGPGPGYNTLPEWEKPKNGFEGLIGDQEPLGLWDPVGFAADQNIENFKRRRETEIKHGRVSMLATIGYIVPEYFKFDGECSPSTGLKFADIPNGLKALSAVPPAGLAQMVAFAGFIELVANKPTGEPGNFGKGFLGLGNVGLNVAIQDPDVRLKKLKAEMANGRLAMMAIIGMFFQDGLTGSAWGDWANYTDSPLRAFEGELGVQAPVGFWDPLGLSADGDVAFFKRRRETELKHGRISMFACIGYIVPEYFRFPGELSPKLGLQFADVPNGLAALSKVPGQGWAQIVGFLGTYELFINGKSINDEPGNYGKGNLGLGFLGPVADPESRKKKLSAELANGRLAMMAIIGMLFQDGLTGSAWGDWALYTDSPLRSHSR